MTDMDDLVTSERVVCDLKAGNKQQLLQSLAEIAARETGLDAGRILEALLQREQLGTTGLGCGIAIPHAKIPELTELTGFFVRLNKPIDFDALDGEPVDLVFVLLAPEAAGGDHLKALARIARILRDGKLCQTLRRSDDRDEVHDLLTRRSDGAPIQASA